MNLFHFLFEPIEPFPSDSKSLRFINIGAAVTL